MTRKRKILTGLLIFALFAPVNILSCLLENIFLLREYKNFINDPENRKSLYLVPTQYNWKDENPTQEETISLGYATFTYPFGSIDKSTIGGNSIILYSPDVEIIFPRPKIYGFDLFQNSMIMDPETAEREYYGICEDIWMPSFYGGITPEQWQKIKSDEWLYNFWMMFNDRPYDWFHQVLTSSPAEIDFSVWSNHDRIFHHFILLKNKAEMAKGTREIILFETSQLKGMIWITDFQDPNFIGLDLYDRQNNISQFFIIKCQKKDIPLDKIKTMLTTYRFENQTIVNSYIVDHGKHFDSACRLPNFTMDAGILIDFMHSLDCNRMKIIIPFIKDINEKANYMSDNYEHYNGITLLHAAAVEGEIDIAQLLLDHGADINAVGESQEMPLHLAVKQGHSEIAEFLLQKGADPNARNENLQTPLHLAVKNNNPDMIEILLKHHADPNAKGEYGFTPLALSQTENITDILLPITQVKFQDPNTNDWPVSIYKAKGIADRLTYEKNLGLNVYNYESLTNKYEGYYLILYSAGFGRMGGSYDSGRKPIWVKVDAFTGEATLHKTNVRTFGGEEEGYYYREPY